MNINDLFVSFDSEEPKRTLVFSFDGTMKDFTELPGADENLLSVLQSIDDPTTELRIVTDLKFDITKNITSQIIHYKDAFKLDNPALIVPYLLYGKKGEQDFAVLLIPECEAGYLYAKALYYCLTEKEGLYDGYMNNIAALYLDPEHIDEVKSSLRDIISGSTSYGWIQRYYDRIYMGHMDHLKELCAAESRRVFEKAKEELEDAEDRRPIIEDAIRRCYLLKKCMYVQYMKTKNLLTGRFGGDIRKQRSAAKECSNAIPFISYSELWRYREYIQNGPVMTTSGDFPKEHAKESAESPAEFAQRVLGIGDVSGE